MISCCSASRFQPVTIRRICAVRFCCWQIVFYSAIILLNGCSEPKANLIPATGTVLLNGKPARGIMLQFVPKTVDKDQLAPTSQAITAEDGTFELLTTRNEVGAVPGPHLVYLYDAEEERTPQGTQPTKPPRLHSRFSSGSLTVEVAADKPIEIKATGP